MLPKKTALFVCFSLALYAPIALGEILEVNCPEDSLAAAVEAAMPGDTISVSGTCAETIEVTTNDLRIHGDNATINSPSPEDSAVAINGAVRVKLSGFTISNGSAGVNGKANASFTLHNLEIDNNILGISLQSGAHAVLEDVMVSGSVIGINLTEGAIAEIEAAVSSRGNVRGFGLNAQNGSVVRVSEDAVLALKDNFVGGQIVVGSSLFIEGIVVAEDNAGIGLSINTGASAILFDASIETNNNGLDGLDVVSAANLDVDGVSTIDSNDNGRDGISIDDGTLNMFGFFVGDNPGPRITANDNGRNGVLVETSGTLDIGVNSAIEATGNSAAGLAIDNGSTVQLRSSMIIGNHGSTTVSEDEEDDDDQKKHRNIDVLGTFGSRITFLADNKVGKAVCDRSTISRGDVKCKR